MGWLSPLRAMPSCAAPLAAVVKAGLLPSDGVVVAVFVGTTGPSDSRFARRCFALVLSAPLRPDSGCEDGSLLFRARPSSHALLRTPEVSCTAPVSSAGCCLRRDMSGSATSPLRVFLSRGCKVHARALGLRRCSPPG